MGFHASAYPRPAGGKVNRIIGCIVARGAIDNRSRQSTAANTGKELARKKEDVHEHTSCYRRSVDYSVEIIGA